MPQSRRNTAHLPDTELYLPRHSRKVRVEHHIMFTKPAYEASKHALRVRNDLGLLARVGVEAHKALHEAVSGVPVLDRNSMKRVANAFEGYAGDPLRSMDLLMATIETATMPAKVNDLDHRLGQLAIDAIDRQRPFISGDIPTAVIIDLGRAA